MPRLILEPLGEQVELGAGAAAREALFAHGVEFPCGGRGRCRGCRVQVLDGVAPISLEDRERIPAEDLAAGWRLGCRLQPTGDCRVAVASWTDSVLGDGRSFTFTPRTGLGVAVDVGSTTVVAQLLDLSDARVLGVRSAVNAQAAHGADIMTRLDLAVRDGGRLRDLLRRQIGALVHELLHGREEVPVNICLVGNTAMHHLFAGHPVAALAVHPFQPHDGSAWTSTGDALGWPWPCPVRFLPCLGGFVGSDLLAGILALGLDPAAQDLEVLVDLGTNGEIAVAGRGRLLCTSTAAGPAFEGARISCGMRATTGAIARVRPGAERLDCEVLGGAKARGICGSGLVDALAAACELGWLGESGRLRGRQDLPLVEGLSLLAGDVREVQLAKGAIAAGIGLLLGELGASVADVARCHVAGAFGNSIDPAAAHRIGLLPVPAERCVAAGNSALLGCKRALFEAPERWQGLATRCEHRDLNAYPGFMDAYVDGMMFPAG